MIKAVNVSTAYGERLMQDKVSFSVKSGEIYGILGGSGTGKTTLLKTMIYLNRPTTGDIFINGENLWKSDEQTKNEMKKQMGVMFQFGALFSSMNVLENIGVMLKEYSNFSDKDIREIAKMWLLKVGLKKEAALLYPSELSGGMKKRVALARALVLSPKVLFLDEPFSALDPIVRLKLQDELKTLSKGKCVIFVTHDIDEALNIADSIVILRQGKIVSNMANPRFDAHSANFFELKAKIFDILNGQNPQIEYMI